MKTRLQVQSWFSYFAETKFVETINVHAIRSIFMYSRISGSIICIVYIVLYNTCTVTN